MNSKKDYSEHFVAFLDILGFKDIIKNNSFDEVHGIFRTIIMSDEVVSKLYREVDSNDNSEDGERRRNYNESLKDASIYIMSDSIVIATPSSYKESLAVVVDICNIIQYMLYDYNPPILLRGAISKGEFYIGKGKRKNEDKDYVEEVTNEKKLLYNNNSRDINNNTLVFGKGLIDAYIAQENCAIYPRVIIADSVISDCYISIDFKSNSLPVDSKDGYCYLDTLFMYILNSAEKTQHSIGDNDPQEFYTNVVKKCDAYRRFKSLIDYNLSVYSDVKKREKYIWLKKEMERIVDAYLIRKGIQKLGDNAYIVC